MTYLALFSNFAPSVVDPHHIDADPDSTYHRDADPDSDFYLMRIRIRFLFDADADPDFCLMLMRIRIQVTQIC